MEDYCADCGEDGDAVLGTVSEVAGRCGDEGE